MGLRDRFSNYLFKKAEKRGYLDDVLGKSIRYGGVYVTDSNILQSSDVYELLQDISNQMVLADIVVEDEFGNETKDDIALRILKNPTDYFTQSEFIKIITKTN
ncbi:phage portal protein, partial [Bacillus thuringiensis]|nr:phage portal protein [Bacillus thuringiensis]